MVAENDVYGAQCSADEVIIDHVTETEIFLRVTDGNCGLKAARRMTHAEWERIRDSHGLLKKEGY